MDSDDYYDEKYQIKSPADAANLVIAEFTHLDHMELHGLPSIVNSAEISQGIFLTLNRVLRKALYETFEQPQQCRKAHENGV